jgi:hypothetical protein
MLKNLELFNLQVELQYCSDYDGFRKKIVLKELNIKTIVWNNTNGRTRSNSSFLKN